MYDSLNRMVTGGTNGTNTLLPEDYKQLQSYIEKSGTA
jgi:hypothetical protein